MDSNEFIQKALATESRPTKLNIGPVAMHMTLSAAIAATEVMELVKKRAFYGKPVDMVALQKFASEASGLFEMVAALAGNGTMNLDDDRHLFPDMPEEMAALTPENVNLRLLHGVIGMNGESGELLKAMLATMEGLPLDMVNLCEETGDSDWYKAIIHDESGVSEERCREKVIAKLEQRYKGKFSAEAATVRDLDAERSALETA